MQLTAVDETTEHLKVPQRPFPMGVAPVGVTGVKTPTLAQKYDSVTLTFFQRQSIYSAIDETKVPHTRKPIGQVRLIEHRCSQSQPFDQTHQDRRERTVDTFNL